MTWRERWAAVPWDIRFGYSAVFIFTALFALRVLVGPDLLVTASSCLVFPLLTVIALVIVCRLACPPRWPRVLPLALVSGCLAITFAFPGATVDLHLITRVYLSGGPNALNDWAQGEIHRRVEAGGSETIQPTFVPPGVHRHLSGYIGVSGTIWSDEVRLRIELGGGFYHYGVVVFSTGSRPPPEWWQRVLGWPPEVVIYHED